LYDKGGDAHYDAISAYIKSLRGSDPDGALYWLARMLEGGEDPEFIARRIVIFASEDIGLADPFAIVRATAASQAVRVVGLPEAIRSTSTTLPYYRPTDLEPGPQERLHEIAELRAAARETGLAQWARSPAEPPKKKRANEERAS